MNFNKKRGRPATGQNTKVIRVPKDFDREKAMQIYYDWLPIIEAYREIAADTKTSPRSQRLIDLLEQLN